MENPEYPNGNDGTASRGRLGALVRRIGPFTLVALIVALAAAGALAMIVRDRDRAEDARTAAAERGALQLERFISAAGGALSSLAAEVDANGVFGERRFSSASVRLLSEGAESSWWLPRVPESAVSEFEERTGRTLRADTTRPGDRFPVLLVAEAGGPPRTGPVGLDHRSDPVLGAAMADAAAAGTLRLSGIADPGTGSPGLVLYRPVYRAAEPGADIDLSSDLVGFVAGGLTPERLLEPVSEVMPAGASAGLTTGPSALTEAGVSRTLRLAGNDITLTVDGPDTSLLLPAVLLIAGLLLAVGVGWLFHLASVRETQGRLAADAFQRERDYTQAVVSAIQDGLIVLDADRRITGVSPRFAEITGHPQDEITGISPPYPFLSDTAAERFDDLLDEVGALGVGEFDLRLVSRDGAAITGILSLAAQRDAEGEIVGYVGTVKDITARKRAEDRARQLAGAEEALRDVATAVASEHRTGQVFVLVARQAMGLGGVDAAAVVTGHPEDEIELVARAPEEMGFERLTDGSSTTATRALASGVPAVGDDGGVFVDGEQRLTLAVPIRNDEAVRGAVVAVLEPGQELTRRLRDTIGALAELCGLAIDKERSRQRLAAEALSDSLTSLANRRRFDDVLRDEVDRARRHARPLALAVVDLDNFKAINDDLGHQVGDEVLKETARRLHELARAGDLVARIGGEEFAWILAETDRPGAAAAARRAWQAIRGRPFTVDGSRIGTVTASVGVAELSDVGESSEEEPDPAHLLRAADAALYRAKNDGRDSVRVHTPGGWAPTFPAQDDGARARTRIRDGLHDLARSVGPQPAHGPPRSDAVAELAAGIASQLGWRSERLLRIREAAALHDVGRVAMPRELNRREGPLAEDEYAALKRHVELSAQLAAPVLDEEQLSWIRHHHERVDGEGYPAGLEGDEIPDGALVIAVADAWVAMTSVRRYRPTMEQAAALKECQKAAGTQFSAEVVAALERHLSETPQVHPGLAPTEHGETESPPA